MGREIPLGRLAGVKVSMDLTVLLLAGFYSFTLATSGFPASAPGLSTSAYWVAGILGALLFFVSLLVHEMGHALVAQDEGIGVRGINLWLLGGVAKLESAPTSARSEFRIAVVGPLASASCGVAFLAGSYALPGGGLGGLAGDVTALLGTINLLLAAFNLLPAAPLDGGTVLSSLIWKRSGSQATGMRWAAYSGIAAGAGLVVLGLRIVRGASSPLNGYSILIVGGFVLFAAIRSLQSLPLYHLLNGITVGQAMVASPPPAAGWTSLGSFLRSLPPNPTHEAYPVLGQNGRAEGLLTAGVIRAVPREQWEHLRVSEVAYPIDRVTVVRAGEPLLPAVQKIDGGDVRDGLVVGPDGAVVGTISASALYRAMERRKLDIAAAT